MGVFEDIVRTITDNLFSQVAILIGLIALVGLALQRKPIEEVVGGAMRATIGVVILNIGIDLFVGGLVAFQAIVSSAMGLEPPAAESTLAEFNEGPGSVVPLIIAGGFVVHLLIVRVFPAARFVYLTGHLMYWMAVVLAATIVEAFGEVDRWIVAGAGAVIIACYWVLQPLWTQPLMRKVMGDDSVGLAHTTSTLALAAGYGARALRLGDPVRHDSERLRLPKALSFFKDITVSTAFVTGIIMLVAIAFADAAIVEEQMAGSAVLPWVWGLLQALRFAAGIAILLFGVRMFLAEIVPAFRGLSEKVLPGTKPALDIPVTFTKGPTSVMVGFITSTVVFLVLMGVFALAGWFVLVPPMIMLFFGGGAGGVFGNAVAGWRGAVFGGLLNGVVLAFGQWIGWGLYGSTAPELATLADPDWYAVGWILLGLGSLLAPLGAGGVWVIAGVVLAITVVVLVVLGRRGGGREVLESVEEPEPVLVGADGAPAGGDGAAVAQRSAAADAARPAELRVLAVCGAGMGSSLILRTTAEAALADLGVAARLDHTDVSSARSATADVVVAQATYLDELGDLAPVMVPIDSFVDRRHVEQRIADALRAKGWL
ncbi:PTS transporter subunit IIC [Agrococcus sp. SGAir0287]|uniref:PTS transporter subunit IIC n=1 Tax=Agrococcus sp. SGAir0287 TaxID=2070347 RepID=UPI0010CCDA30|nr:PTS transporter subunit IIC [Agrococcus sp. SGAir0287]QCR18205.1 PTS ascorbate transporter subunit IIC [Agrococcus sp. SGAir0287]